MGGQRRPYVREHRSCHRRERLFDLRGAHHEECDEGRCDACRTNQAKIRRTFWSKGLVALQEVAHATGGDAWLVGDEQRHHQLVTKAHDASRITACGPVHRQQRTKGEQPFSGGAACQSQTVPHKSDGLPSVERAQHEVLVDAVLEVGQPVDDLFKFALPEDDDLQQLLGVGLVVEQLAQHFEAVGCQLLPFIDAEQHDTPAFHGKAEQRVLDGFDAVAPG